MKELVLRNYRGIENKERFMEMAEADGIFKKGTTLGELKAYITEIIISELEKTGDLIGTYDLQDKMDFILELNNLMIRL